MDRFRWPFFGALAALVISLGANLRSALDDGTDRAAPPTASATADAVGAQPSADGAATSEPGAGQGGAGCCAALEACRSASWDIALKAIQRDAREHSATQPREPKPADGGSSAALDARRQALCELSEDFLRRLWTNDRDKVMAFVQDFGTQAWSENWASYKAGAIGEMLGLDDSQKELVSAGYDSLWKHYGPNLQRQLAHQPPDYDAMLRAAQAYFHEEDLLIGNVLGNGARDRYSDSELQTRVLVLAIIGTYAGKPFGDALSW